MMTEVRGDIWHTDRKHIVIPVNSVGAMGAGLARQCRDRYPEAQTALRRLAIKPGEVLPLIDTGTHSLLAAATKNHWQNPSQMNWVRGCFRALLSYDDVAVPLLGAGLGGLKPALVLHTATMYLNLNLNTYDLYVGP